MDLSTVFNNHKHQTLLSKHITDVSEFECLTMANMTDTYHYIANIHSFMEVNITLTHPTNDSVRGHVIPPELATGLQIYLTIASIFGSIGNLMILIATARTKQLQTSPNIFFVNLAVADFMVCIIAMPAGAVTLTYDIPEEPCKLIGFVAVVMGNMSIISLFMIALNRYVLICRPRETYYRLYSKKNIMLSFLLVWTLDFAIFALPLFRGRGYGRSDYFGGMCSLKDDQLGINYYFIFITGDLLLFYPTSVMCLVFYVRIYLKFKRSEDKLQMYAAMLPVPSLNSALLDQLNIEDEPETRDTRISCSPLTLQYARQNTMQGHVNLAHETDDCVTHVLSNESYHPSHKQKHIHVLKNVSALWLVFSLTWLPMVMLHRLDSMKQSPPGLSASLYILAITNSAFNFVLYGMYNRNFRNVFKKMF